MEKQLHISDIIQEYISGDWGEDSNPDNSLVKVACVRGADINDVNGSFFKNIPIRYITTSSLSKKGLKEGNIVIEKSGGAPTQSTGRVAYISKECIMEHPLIVCSNFCAAFSVKPEWDAQYIFYYLQYFYNTGVFFNFEGKTSGLHNLDIEHAFASIPIKRIDIDTQRRIASVLSNLDRKIALNRQINANLEALARQLYDYWFVQFDFPDANGKPYKSSGGKMTYNEKLKRHIPDGWEVKTIETILGKVPSTYKLKSKEYKEYGKYPIIDQASDIYIAGYTDRYDAVVSMFPVVVFGDHSCAVKYVNFDFCRGADGTQILYSIDERVSTEYLYFAVKDTKFQSGYARHFSLLKDSLIILPDKSIAKKYCELSRKYFDLIKTNIAEISSLTRQRDELLPLLMNGQVTIE